MTDSNPSLTDLLAADDASPESIDGVIAIGEDIIRYESELQGPMHALSGHISALPARQVTEMRQRLRLMIAAEQREHGERMSGLKRVLEEVDLALGIKS